MASIPISEAIALIGDRTREMDERNLNYPPLGPLHPRTMLYVLDMLLRMDADAEVKVKSAN